MITVTCDPWDTLWWAGQGPLYADTQTGPGAFDEQDVLARQYGELWSSVVRQLAAEEGVEVSVYVGRNGPELDEMRRQTESDLARELWQSAHDRIGVGLRAGVWVAWDLTQ